MSKTWKTYLNSKFVFIIALNILLIIIPLYGFTVIRSSNYQAQYIRLLSAQEINYYKAYASVPVIAPYQRTLIIDPLNLDIKEDSDWIKNDVFTYQPKLDKVPSFIRGFFSGPSRPTLSSFMIIEQLKESITKNKRQTGTLKGRYLYGMIPFKKDHTRGLMALTIVDKSDIQINNFLAKGELFILTIFSGLLAFLSSCLYYRQLIKPLNILSKAIQESHLLSSEPYIQGLTKKKDELGQLTRAFIRKSRVIHQKGEEIISFTEDVLHELKNPLASIRNSLELLEDHTTSITDQDHLIEILQNETGRMELLLHEIREYSLFGTEKENKHISSTIYPHLILLQIIKLYNSYDIQLSCNCKKAINMKENDFISIMTNILDNGTSFSPQPGSIHITYEQDKEKTILKIGDKGPGVADKNKIFDRFYSYRPGETIKNKHSGLGLAIVKRIIDSYGYSIICEENKPEGTCFLLYFPTFS
ncbi:HAMP domain-containing sensor histidine kinase [Spirochaeta cellobiosiphila]|uniref:HAMP domain-containing sensor histidine kinase n=1 Tax=Spirochaeta cellobiosiphila TaxID=504483 RepID=UPI00040CA671|nr:HAMP domain-containing sensor histidine kinase [Spirochaeta cellobiosiphila]